MAAENNAVPPGCKLPAGGFLGRIHVLVVDDDAAYLEELKLMLLLSGYSVTGKTTVEEALGELDQKPEDYFDIVMTDVHMSEMDGFDLLHGVKGRLPVIMFSEGEDIVTVTRAMMDGACDYMVKPMTSEMIRIIWKHVLRRRLSALPTQASSFPSDRLVAALVAVAPRPLPVLPAGSTQSDGQEAALAVLPPPTSAGKRCGDIHEVALVLPPALAHARNRGEEVQEAALAQPPMPAAAVKRGGDVQKAGLAQHPMPVPFGNWRDDIQETAVTVEVAVGSSCGDGQGAATKASSKKRGASEVSEKGSNNVGTTIERKKARARFTWTTKSHTAFVKAYYQLKDQEGPKRIQQLMELDGIFVTKAQVSSHLQKYRDWLETTRKQEEASSLPNTLLNNYANFQDRNYGNWKRSSIITEGPLARMFSGGPVHSMATSNDCLTTTQSNYVGVGPKEIDNFISSHQRYQRAPISHESVIRQAGLHSEVTSASCDVYANGSSQARQGAMSTSAGVDVTNENLLQVVSASLRSNVGQIMQPAGQSFYTKGLVANFNFMSNQNLGTSYPANSIAINNQNPVTQEMSVSQRVEIGNGDNVMLDWPELGGLDDQLDNGMLMNSLFDGDQLQQGVVTAIDKTQEMLAFDSTSDLGSVLPQALNTVPMERTTYLADLDSGHAE